MRIHHFRNWTGAPADGWASVTVGNLAEALLAKRRMDQGAVDTLPEQIPLRLVEVRVAVPGFRTQRIVWSPPLLEADKYTSAELGQLYFRRWAVRTVLRDIKITLGMDGSGANHRPWSKGDRDARHRLQPDPRTHAGHRAKLSDPTEPSSFKGTVDALRQWSELFSQPGSSWARAKNQTLVLITTIATDPLIARPNRLRARAVKRSPKSLPLC